MSTFTANGACGACTVSALANMAASLVSSDCFKRPVAFIGKWSSTKLQGCPYPLNKRTANHSRAPTRLERPKLRKLAAGSGSRKKAAGHTAASLPVLSHPSPMTDHLLVLKGGEEEAEQEIHRGGGQIHHWFGNSVFVAALGQGFDTNGLTKSSPLPDSYKGSTSTLSLIQAWRDSKKDDPMSEKDYPKSWDAQGHTPPGNIWKAQNPSPAGDHTISFIKAGTKYLAGKVGLICIVVSGKDSASMEKEEVANAFKQIQEGTDFWVKADPLANITFRRVNLEAKIPDVADDLGDGLPAEQYEDHFVVPAVKSLGKDNNNLYSTFDELLKFYVPDPDTWGYCVFICKFKLWHYAYKKGEHPGGDRIFMDYRGTNGDGDWNSTDLNAIFAHESGHIFGALDEYKSSECTCEVNRYSKVPVINGNCENCKPPSRDGCIMRLADITNICPYTRGQVGWEWWGKHSELDWSFATISSPALASDGTNLYLAWKNTGDGFNSKGDGVRIMVSKDQGKSWAASVPTGVMTKENTGPRLAFFNTKLYMAFVDPTGKLKVNRRTSETDWEELRVPSSTSDYEPSLALFGGRLYMAFRRADGSQKISMWSTDNGDSWAGGGVWGGGDAIAEGVQTRLAPTICTLPASLPGDTPTLFLAFLTPGDQTIHVMTSKDAKKFINKQTAASSVHGPNCAPALCALPARLWSSAEIGDRMYMVFFRNEGQDRNGEDIPQRMMYISCTANNDWTQNWKYWSPDEGLNKRFLPGGPTTDRTPSLVADTTGGLLMAFKSWGEDTGLNTVRLGGPVAY